MGTHGYTDSVPSKKPFLAFVIEPELLDRLDEFQHERRFPTRAAAIKWLLAWAMDQNPDTPTKPGARAPSARQQSDSTS